MEEKGLEICGYRVSRKRQAVWSIEVELLKKFIKACEENNLNYFLIGGTAIGAVRHKGFIPWDDDFDIGMLRVDFDQFLSISKKYFNGSSEVQYGIQKNSLATFMRIRNANTTAIIRNQKDMDINHGVFIEIYPFDKVPSGKMLRTMQWKLSAALIDVMQHRYNDKKLGITAKILGAIFSKRTPDGIFIVWNKVCTFFNKYNMKKVDTVSIPIYSASEVDLYDECDVKETQLTDFEDFKVKIPVGNDKCLRKTYGDYMELPPLEQRGMHHSRDIFYDPYHSFGYYQSRRQQIEKFFMGENDAGLL